MGYTVLYSFWFLFFAAVATYIVWGFVIAFEVVLAMTGAKWACRWLKAHHTYKQLYWESVIFYPMILIAYGLFEWLPHYLFRVKEMAPFDIQKLFDRLYGDESDVPA